MKSLLSTITESCFEKGKSAGKKNKILSNSRPFCCPLFKSNTHDCMASFEIAVDNKPIVLSNTRHYNTEISNIDGEE